MKRVTFTHVLSWRDPVTKKLFHVDEHKVLHVLDPEEPCEVMNFLVSDDTQVEVGDWWNGDQESPLFSKQHLLGLGPEWDDMDPIGSRAGFNAG